jgi:hypothetical protein
MLCWLSCIAASRINGSFHGVYMGQRPVILTNTSSNLRQCIYARGTRACTVCVHRSGSIDAYIPTSLKQLTGSSLGELHSSVTDVAFGRLFSAMHGKFATPSCMEDKLKVCGTRARVLKLTRQTTRRKWQSRIISTDICSWLIASGTRSAGVHIR